MGKFNVFIAKYGLTILYSIIVIVVIIVLYKVLKGFGIFANEASKQAKDASKEIKKVKVDKNKLPKHTSAYLTIADMQFEAMNAWGTDEDKLFDSLNGLNTEELKQVAKDFGVRSSTIQALPSIWTPISKKRNIFEWYTEELSGNALGRMKEVWKNTTLW